MVISRLVNIEMQREVLKSNPVIKIGWSKVWSCACIHVDHIIRSYKVYLIYCRLVEDYLELNGFLDKPNPLTKPVPRELELKTLEHFKLQMNIFVDKGSSTIAMFGLSRELQQFGDKARLNFPIQENIQEKNNLDKISRSFQALSSKENEIIMKQVKLTEEKVKDVISMQANMTASLESLKSLTEYLSLKVYR